MEIGRVVEIHGVGAGDIDLESDLVFDRWEDIVAQPVDQLRGCLLLWARCRYQIPQYGGAIDTGNGRRHEGDAGVCPDSGRDRHEVFGSAVLGYLRDQQQRARKAGAEAFDNEVVGFLGGRVGSSIAFIGESKTQLE